MRLFQGFLGHTHHIKPHSKVINQILSSLGKVVEGTVSC